MRLIRRKFRKPDLNGKLELERVIGLTTSNANGLSYNPVTNDIAYLAGNVVVIYNVLEDRQTRFLIVSRAPKALSSVVFSPGGKYIAAGESGHQPSVIVLDASTGSCISELKAHKNGVSCLQFSPNGKHLVSIGVPYDGFLCLWDWKAGALLTKVRVTMPAVSMKSVHFSSDGSFLITAGVKHLKQWTIGGQSIRKHSSKGIGTIALEGRQINLGSLQDNSFVAIACSCSTKELSEGENQSGCISPLYALTSSGILCLLHRGIAVEKWVDLKVTQAFDISVSETHVACACSAGVVRIFFVKTLAYAATLPRPAPCGYHGLTDAKLSTILSGGNVKNVQFPNAVACTFLNDGKKIAVVYDDHGLYLWDLSNMSQVGRYKTFLAHSDCIWDITVFPIKLQGPAQIGKDIVPERMLFVTCSADGSIRIWTLESRQESQLNCLDIFKDKAQNVYCKDLVGVLYLEKNGEFQDRFSCSSEKESQDSVNGFRAISISPNGRQLAAGDRNGNIYVYDVESLKLVSFKVIGETVMGSLAGST